MNEQKATAMFLLLFVQIGVILASSIPDTESKFLLNVKEIGNRLFFICRIWDHSLFIQQ